MSKPTRFDFGTSNKNLKTVGARWKPMRDREPLSAAATYCYLALCGWCGSSLGLLKLSGGPVWQQVTTSTGSGPVMSFGRGGRGPWVMRPEAALPSDPVPVYYGFADSGFRIATAPGKTVATDDDRRVGRSPYRFDGLEGAPDAFAKEFAGRIKGQAVLLPCRIWCPECERPNDVPLPPGFQQRPDGTIADRPDGQPGLYVHQDTCYTALAGPTGPH